MEMSAYHICLLRKGPAWSAEETPELAQLQARHVAYNTRLRELGKTIASGPVNDASDIRGFSIYRTATLGEAQALAAPETPETPETPDAE